MYYHPRVLPNVHSDQAYQALGRAICAVWLDCIAQNRAAHLAAARNFPDLVGEEAAIARNADGAPRPTLARGKGVGGGKLQMMA